MSSCAHADDDEYLITVTLSTDKTIYFLNETAAISLVAHNTGSENYSLGFHSGQIADCEVLDAQGNQVYLWSHGKFFTMALRNITLPAGETMDFLTFTWDLTNKTGDPLPPGGYFVRGWIAQNKPWAYSNEVAIHIQGQSDTDPEPVTPGYELVMLLFSLGVIFVFYMFRTKT